MTSFPLYDSLSSGLPTKDLSAKQKGIFMTKVSSIDNAGAELIYALIRVYEMENSDDMSFKLPYGGTYNKSDMIFNLSDIPIALRHILYKFVNIHTKTMEEEAVLNKQRLITSDDQSAV